MTDRSLRVLFATVLSILAVVFIAAISAITAYIFFYALSLAGLVSQGLVEVFANLTAVTMLLSGIPVILRNACKF